MSRFYYCFLKLCQSCRLIVEHTFVHWHNIHSIKWFPRLQNVERFQSQHETDIDGRMRCTQSQCYRKHYTLGNIDRIFFKRNRNQQQLPCMCAFIFFLNPCKSSINHHSSLFTNALLLNVFENNHSLWKHFPLLFYYNVPTFDNSGEEINECILVLHSAHVCI